MRVRGRCSGNGRRAGLRSVAALCAGFGLRSAARSSVAASAWAAVSCSSVSASSSCSNRALRSDEVPNRCRRSRAISSLRRSISRSRTLLVSFAIVASASAARRAARSAMIIACASARSAGSGSGVVIARRESDQTAFVSCHVIPRRSDARFAAASSSRSPPTKAYRNIPSCESDESPIEEIRVVDPRHPLYGRSFRVIRRSTHHSGNCPLSYEVEYCNGSSLLIPVDVTEWYDLPNNRTILSIDALRDLISVIDCLDSHGDRSKRSLDDTAVVYTTSGRRRRRRRLGGGLS